MKPNVGDVVDIDVLSEEEKTGNLVKIHKMKESVDSSDGIQCGSGACHFLCS